MRKSSNAFTIVELIVVIGICAVLAALLLPSLMHARARSNTVVCASNLRQIYQAELIYAQDYNNYVMPCEGGAGSSRQYWWWGTRLLGASLGLKSANPTAASDLQVVNKVSIILYCPALDRAKMPDIAYSGDYTYNDDLGDIRGQDPTNASYKAYSPWAFFKRMNRVPPNVLVAIDAAPVIAKNDDHFACLSDLTTSDPIYHPFPRASAPHAGKANALFFDGTVRSVDPNKDLQSWMILAPGNLNNPDAEYYTTDPNAVWQPKRPLPF